MMTHQLTTIFCEIDDFCKELDQYIQHYHVWHTRHRSVIIAMTHLVSALAAYAIEPLKLSAIKLIAKTPN